MIKDNRRDEISKMRARLKHELSIASAERDKISKIKSELYGDYKQDIISFVDYKDVKERFESKYLTLNDKVHKLTEDIRQLDSSTIV